MGLQYGNYKNTDIGTYSQRSDHNRLGFWYTTAMPKRVGKAGSVTAQGDAQRRVDGFTNMDVGEIRRIKKSAFAVRARTRM